ncbi:FAD dependent oxidoreductase [Stappia sp. 22II-S9-Z10]|nr:FAD dependent oxidoreductase [Stappia sp. 22II-S9-Z10]
MENRSVAVIGGGIVGLCTAYHLARLGARVSVFDRTFGLDGASSGNAGSISSGSVLPVAYRGMARDIPKMLFDPSGPLRVTMGGMVRHAAWLARFLRESSEARIRASAELQVQLVPKSLAAHTALLEAIGSTDLIRTTGQLHLYPDAAARAKDAFGWALRREHGVVAHDLDRAGVLQIEPSIGPAYQAGIFLPDQGMIVDPGGYVGRMQSVLRQAGAALVTGEVRGVTPAADGGVSVETADGVHAFGEAVIAAGAWSGPLVKRLGLSIPLANQRGFHVQFPHSGVELQRVVVIADRKVFVTPMTGGLRAAGTVEITPLGSPVDMRRAAALVDHVKRVWPEAATEPHTAWSGERPCLPDTVPVMGRAPGHPNVWLNFGHGHLGMTLSAVCGEAIAQSMAAGEPNAIVRLFGPERFGN